MGQLDQPLLSARHQGKTGRLACAVAWACLVIGHTAQAQMPQGGRVVAGSVSLPSQAATQQTLTQYSNKAIVNWESFSIGAGNRLRIDQPGRNAVLLNRVTGGQPSSIFGQLSANGQVFLLNPQGIYFAPGAQLDVGGLLASTLSGAIVFRKSALVRRRCPWSMRA
jgi:trimeric autotransporter adhesin